MKKIIKIAGLGVLVFVCAYIMTLFSIMFSSPITFFAPLNDCYPIAQECAMGHKAGGFPFTFLLGETVFGFWPNMIFYVVILLMILLVVFRWRKGK